jgi:aspartate aminotransferase
MQEQTSKAYIGVAGSLRYCELVAEMILGQGHTAIVDQRLSIAQTPGGSGALRVAAELVKAANPTTTIWMGNPTWANHQPIFSQVGLQIRQYPYYDHVTKAIDFDALMATLATAAAGDLVLLHACCHNPSGADLHPEHWQALTELVLSRGLVPLVDIAYQGLGDGLAEDAYGVRLLASQAPELLIASSCSKNFGVYRERTGTLLVLSDNRQQARVSTGQLLAVIRASYSMPPSHGAALVEIILQDAALRQNWAHELTVMRQRIAQLRVGLVDQLQQQGAPQDFNFIIRQKGMFSFLGISPQQVNRLVNEYSVYLVNSSRINIAGLNKVNLPYVTNSIIEVLRS